MNSEQRLELVATQLEVEHAGLKRDLESRLKYLAQDIVRAQKALAADKFLDSNIVHNSGVDNLVERWNQVLRLLPYAKADV